MAQPLSKRARQMASVADQAIKAGMKVLAIRPHSKQPDTRFCPHGWKDATDSLAKVKTWLREDDALNLAASTYGSGICVVDVDGPKGARAAREIANLPGTRKSKTPDGTRRFYRYEGDLGGSITKFRPDSDLLLNTYVLLPGSNHPDGGVYESADFSVPLTPLPTAIAEAILAHRKEKKRDRKAGSTNGRFREGHRNDRLASIAGHRYQMRKWSGSHRASARMRQSMKVCSISCRMSRPETLAFCGSPISSEVRSICSKAIPTSARPICYVPLRQQYLRVSLCRAKIEASRKACCSCRPRTIPRRPLSDA